MIVIVGKMQVKACISLLDESTVIMPSYTVYCSRVDAKTFRWASMIPLSHLSFVQCEQVKSRSEKRVEINVSHSAVAIGQ